MPMDAFTNQFTGQALEPFMDPMNALEWNVNIGPGQVIPRGTVLAQVAAAANDVQTITVTASGGTFTVSVTIEGVQVTTAAVAFNVSTANLQAALTGLSNVGAGAVAVTGTPGSSYVLTFQGNLANRPIPVVTLGTAALTGGSATVAHTTTGQTLGTYAPYSGAVASAPVPVPSATGSGSAFAAGTYLVQVTAVTAQGESTPSAAVAVTLAAANKIRIAAITGLNTAITAVNVYVNGVKIGTLATSGGATTQTDFDVASITLAGSPPATNTAFTGTAGLSTPRGISKYDIASDASGLITFGVFAAGATPSGGQFGETYRTAPVYFCGTFRTTELVGFDANAVTSMGGRLLSGTAVDGVYRLG